MSNLTVAEYDRFDQDSEEVVSVSGNGDAGVVRVSERGVTTTIQSLKTGSSYHPLRSLFDAPFHALGLPNSWVFHVSIITSAVIVLGYIFLGGLTSAIYNEVIQFFLIVAGFFPLVCLGLKNVGGWSGLTQKLPAAYVHAWHGMDNPQHNLLGVDWFGLVMGLGFVLSFGYWCTDFPRHSASDGS